MKYDDVSKTQEFFRELWHEQSSKTIDDLIKVIEL